PRKRRPTKVTVFPALVPGRLWARAKPSMNSESVSHRRSRTTRARTCAITARPPPNPTAPILRKERNRPPRVAVREMRFSLVRVPRTRLRTLRTRILILPVRIDDESTYSLLQYSSAFVTGRKAVRLSGVSPPRRLIGGAFSSPARSLFHSVG